MRPAQPELFTVQINAEPATARLALDGEAATIGTLTRQLVKDGKPHTLEITADGFDTKRITFVDAPPDPAELKLVASAAPPPVPVPEPPIASEPRLRKTEDSSRRANAPAAGGPSGRLGTLRREPAPRRKVGSNDAPLLY